jgi:biofilm protein TabA
MIIGNLPLQGIPPKLPALIRAMLEHLAATDLSNLPLGRTRFPGIDEEDAFFIVQRYDSREPSACFPERHRRFVDLQYIALGREALGWSPYAADDPVQAAYDPEKDVELFSRARRERFVHLFEGDYAILDTDDVHRPGCRIDAPESVLKIVGKARAELLSPPGSIGSWSTV